nr:MAG TPA: hypothetical protein [Caudoviricetes sp.]
MMKFTMSAKDLKTMMEKGIAAINKKATLSTLTRLYFQIDENGILKVWGTDLEHWAEVKSDNVYDTQPGVLGIDMDDIKIISKMSGEITLEDVTTEDMEVGKINIKCGKKIVTIPRHQNIDIFLPPMDESEKKIMSVKENWLFETLVNLNTYIADDDNRKMMQVFNFNTKSKRIEALDGHRIGMRTLENQTIYETTENPFDTVKIHNKCVPVFKKLMDKKSEKEIEIYQDEKYIRLKGNDFTYMIHRIDGEYFKVDSMLDISDDYRFVPDREQILEAMKYDAELGKISSADKKPVVLHSENGKLYSYIAAGKYEAFDEFETSENNMKDNFYISFNPQFLTDAFNIVDSDKPLCFGTGSKAPLLINGDEYKILVLPVNIENDEYSAEFTKKIRGEVA